MGVPSSSGPDGPFFFLTSHAKPEALKPFHHLLLNLVCCLRTPNTHLCLESDFLGSDPCYVDLVR